MFLSTKCDEKEFPVKRQINYEKIKEILVLTSKIYEIINGASLLFFQMKVCMEEFRSLAARYSDLHQSSFDADYATLRNVELYP